MLITLLTDFGTADYFVGAMKGVILSINPSAQIVDITHDIPPYDIQSAAFTLAAAYQTFPEGTIHIGVVDPGVGSARRALIVSAGNQLFVGPDNGLFSYIQAREAGARVLHVTNSECFRHPVSATFQGRDVFAPLGAALSKGTDPGHLGVEINNCVLLPDLRPKRVGTRTTEASIIHIDRFGNCITNLTRDYLTEQMIKRGVYLLHNETKIASFRNFFEEGRVNNDALFALWGSAGYLEIVAFGRSAAELLAAERGQLVVATLSD